MSQIVQTLCVSTRDAVERDDSKMTFELKIDNPSFKGVKVALGSLEFPMVQYTIEEEWNRLYFSEGIALDESNNTLELRVGEDDYTFHFPLRLNAIQSWRIVGTSIVATCQHPHCLEFIPDIDWSDVEVVASPFGRTSIQDAFFMNRLSIVDEYKFSIPLLTNNFVNDYRYPNAGILVIPTIPNPQIFCRLLNRQCGQVSDVSLSFTFDTKHNRFVPQLKNTLREPVVVQFAQQQPLCRLLGLGMTLVRLDASELKTLETQTFSGWDYVALEPGWYSPAHRPMCTGSPLQFSQEVEEAFNRLFFQLPQSVQTGEITSHYLVFVDPCGHMHFCAVPPGRYTPETFCTHLELEMTRLASTTTEGVMFTVEYTNEEYFVFTCECRAGNNIVSNAPFSLLFNHPKQFNPSRIGFPAQPLIGMSTYRSTHRTHFPRISPLGRSPSNVYRVSEIGHQKRLRIHGTTAPALTGLILAYNNDQSILTLNTYLALLPYANGYQPGDIIKLAPCEKRSILEYDIEQKTWLESTPEPCQLAPQWGRTAIVLSVDESADDTYVMCTVYLRVRQTPDLRNCIGNTIQLHTTTEPFNLCFNLSRSIKPHIVGFGVNAVLWGRHGSIESGNYMVPPFEASSVHCLDHPDYVIMTLDEGRSTGLQHTFGSCNKNVFAKIVLYPLAREMGMMPRDMSLSGTSNLNRFTINFFNPDGEPYKFHGSEFSFSLNLVNVIPQS